LQLIRRFHNGLSANLQYTFSKSIDNTSLLGGRGQGTQVIAQNWLDLNGERALSSFDQRHKVSFQFQYTTGVGVKGGTLMSGWRGTAFKGWTFLNTINAGTGMPLTPIYQTALDGTAFSGTIRPNYTGAPLYAAPPGYFLNLAAFAAPVGTFGNAGRNIITGPAQFTMNSSMARTFHDNIDLRFDATNTLNHVTFPSWNTVINSSQFGLPNPANAMRVVQVTMRWRF
jgi:trimeric autotransporter adhesin